MSVNNQSKSLEEVNASVDTSRKTTVFGRFTLFLGPAYLISVGYMDPGNWATDIAGGSKFGYSLLWVLLMSNIIALLLQTLSAKLGIVQKMDLAQASKKTYAKIPNFILYTLAEIAIIACDLAEVIGMAIGLNLLFDIPLLYGVLLSSISAFLVLFLLNKGIKKMEGFIISIVFIIGVSFLINLLIVKPEMTEVVKGLKPTILGGEALYIAIGIIGATVMPHNLYLHSSLVQTRKFEQSEKGMKRAIKYNLIDTAIALNMAFFVNAAILVLSATAFYNNGYFEVAEIEDAHYLLHSIFGSLAPKLFAIALIAAGLSSTITGTLAGQIVMEGYLNLKMKLWVRRLITRSLAMIPAIIGIVYFGNHALSQLLILSQVVLSVQLAFAIIPLIRICGNKNIMKKFVMSKLTKFLAWVCAGIIVILNLKLVFSELESFFTQVPIFVYIVAIFIVLSLLILLLYISFSPLPKQFDDSFMQNNEVVDTLGDIKIDFYNKIIVALEFNHNDINILRCALNQGGKNSKYVLVHIVESAATNYHGEDVNDQEYIGDSKNLKRYMSYLEKKGYDVAYEIRYGKISSNLIDVIVNEKADLLIMGNHGHSGIGRIIFGSTASKIKSKINIPVLIAPKNY